MGHDSFELTPAPVVIFNFLVKIITYACFTYLYIYTYYTTPLLVKHYTALFFPQV